jgi:hypothetical protein
MKRITIEYLAKLGVGLFINSETGFLEAQRIDEPESFAEDMQLSFIPPYLNSDEEARDIIFSLDEIMLSDETLSQEYREIIGEDCYEVLVNF